MDFLMTNDGDLAWDYRSGSFRVANGTEQLVQNLTYVLRTAPGDDAARPEIGCDTQRLAGQPNTSTLGEAIKSAVSQAIVSSQLLASSMFTVDVFPVGIDSVRVMISVKLPGARQPLSVNYNMNVNSGTFDRLGGATD